jgi:hypothetical protein
MDSDDDFRIYRDSCPPLEALVKQLRSEHRPGLSGVWKRLFLIAVHRLKKSQPSLALLTAVEALRIIRSSAAASGRYEKSFPLRSRLAKLKAMDDRPLRGLTTPRKGFHPIDLHLWKNAALRTFKSGVDESTASNLWKQCGGSGLRIPKALYIEL